MDEEHATNNIKETEENVVSDEARVDKLCIESDVPTTKIIEEKMDIDKETPVEKEGEQSSGSPEEQPEEDSDDKEEEKSETKKAEKRHDSPLDIRETYTKEKSPSDTADDSIIQESIVSEGQNDDEEVVRTPRKRINWSKFEIKLPEERRITYSLIMELCPSLKLMSEEEVVLETEETIKHIPKSVKSEERRYTIKSPPSIQEEDIKDEDKEVSNIGLNRKISIVNDEASKLQPPPSPAKNPLSSVLFITNLVRPFTLKQLKELLSRTGTILEDGFWTDRIKSKCYVQYETEDEAVATRNALHGVQWPIGNGKKLIIEFGTVEEMEAARTATIIVEVAPATVKPVPEKIIEKVVEIKKDESEKNSKYEKQKISAPVREWDLGKVAQERDRSPRNRNKERDKSKSEKDRDRTEKRRHSSPSNGEHTSERKIKKKEEEMPAKLMDDLFHKTKAVPSIYWLPLTPEMIAKKQQERLQRMAEHKRRLEESRRAGRDFGRGAPRSRRRSGRYDD